MQPGDVGTLSEDAWLRLLARRADGAALSPLYGPLLAPPSAPDGCFVLGRIAQTLDGRIATPSGTSFWISGPGDILHTHRLRALSDVLVIGAGTVRADDPQLTTRLCSGPSPVRVVIDTDRRLHADFRVFRGGPPTLLFCAADCAGDPRHGEADVVPIARHAAGRGLDIPAILAELAARGLRRIFVEGGGITMSRFLAAGAFDRLHVTLAPLLLGSGIPAFTLPCPASPDGGMRLTWTPYVLGQDMLFDIPLHRSRPPACA
jgi:diaminohydroxyphosphoribosylaminopyrimidine deaminase/5-amino-6-(5-phosphoribosylamino)uracil reductase